MEISNSLESLLLLYIHFFDVVESGSVEHIHRDFTYTVERLTHVRENLIEKIEEERLFNGELFDNYFNAINEIQNIVSNLRNMYLYLQDYCEEHNEILDLYYCENCRIFNNIFNVFGFDHLIERF